MALEGWHSKGERGTHGVIMEERDKSGKSRPSSVFSLRNCLVDPMPNELECGTKHSKHRMGYEGAANMGWAEVHTHTHTHT